MQAQGDVIYAQPFGLASVRSIPASDKGVCSAHKLECHALNIYHDEVLLQALKNQYMARCVSWPNLSCAQTKCFYAVLGDWRIGVGNVDRF